VLRKTVHFVRTEGIQRMSSRFSMAIRVAMLNILQ
jgi:hypothetical protein